MILTFVKIVTEDHSSSIYSSPICDSIGRKGNSFVYYKNANDKPLTPLDAPHSGDHFDINYMFVR